MTTRRELDASFELLKNTALRVKHERDVLYSALKLCLLRLEIAEMTEQTTDNDQLLAVVREAIALAESP